jgi:hypothetical protein
MDTEEVLQNIQEILDYYRSRGPFAYSLAMSNWAHLLAMTYYKKFDRIPPLLMAVFLTTHQHDGNGLMEFGNVEAIANSLDNQYLNRLGKIYDEITTNNPEPIHEKPLGPVPPVQTDTPVSSQPPELADEELQPIHYEKDENVMQHSFSKSNTRKPRKPTKPKVVEPQLRTLPSMEVCRELAKNRIDQFKRQAKKKTRTVAFNKRNQVMVVLPEQTEPIDKEKMILGLNLDNLKIPNKILALLKGLGLETIEDFKKYEYDFNHLSGVGLKTNAELIGLHAATHVLGELNSIEIRHLLSDTGVVEYVKAGGQIPNHLLPPHVFIPIDETILTDICGKIDATTSPDEAFMVIHQEIFDVLKMDYDDDDTLDTLSVRFTKYQKKAGYLETNGSDNQVMSFSWGSKLITEFHKLDDELERKQLLLRAREGILSQLEGMMLNPGYLATLKDNPVKEDKEKELA